MLLMKPGCENCDTNLPADEPGAMICSFECTWCEICAETLQYTCPNCGGALVSRPIRATELLENFPATTERTYKPRS